MNAITKLTPQDYKFHISILIPMYNEEETILFLLNKVRLAMESQNFELIVVDDGSSDNSKKEVDKFQKTYPNLNFTYVYQANMGKGGAMRTAIEKAQGEILVVQDADMEYDPQDILPLIEAFKDGTQVVYGSRNMVKEGREHSSLFFYWGGLLVTYATNFLFGSKLTDEATGYKLFHASLFERHSFKHNDFAWEPEITAKILKDNIPIVELPITYKPRSKDEGKKISWQDGVKAIWVLLCEYFKK